MWSVKGGTQVRKFPSHARGRILIGLDQQCDVALTVFLSSVLLWPESAMQMAWSCSDNMCYWIQSWLQVFPRGTSTVCMQKPTPLTLKGPVTSRSPESSCLRNTALFPLNLPANKMTIVPGVKVDLNLAAFLIERRFRGVLTSSAG